MLAACVAPLPAPPRAQPLGSANAQLPLEQKAGASNVRVDVQVAPTAMQPMEAVLRYQAQRQLYDAGYRPPNALLDVTR